MQLFLQKRVNGIRYSFVRLFVAFFISMVLPIFLANKIIFAERINNIKDIYSPRWDVDKLLTSSELRKIYGKEEINEENKKITENRGTQKVIDTERKTKVWDKNDFNLLIYSNITPSVEGKFVKGDDVDIYGVLLSSSVILTDQICYINGGLTKSSERQPFNKPIFMNIFGGLKRKNDFSKYKITFNKTPVTFQEIDVRIRKNLMNDSEIQLYQYNTKVNSGNWDIDYKSGQPKKTDFFKYPDYRDNELIDLNNVSHFDIYLNPK